MSRTADYDFFANQEREYTQSGDDAMFSHVIQETQDYYRTIKSIYERSDYYQQYPLTNLWGTQNMEVLLNIINNQADPLSKIAAIHNTFMFSVSTSDEDIKNKVVDWYIDYLFTREVTLQSLDPVIQESPYSNPANCVWREGRRLSPDFLRTVALSLEIQEYCDLPAGKFGVLELGAGYGGLARTLKLLYPDISYVIVDIPESLYFSSTFLRLNFPSATVCYVTDSEHLKEPMSKYDFMFVPAIFAEELRGNEFALFCNTASLGEMKNSVIRYWMDLVQNKLNVKYFFGLNRFLNTVDPIWHKHRLDENCCSVSLDEGWRILQWELEAPFTRCPYLETEVSRNLEVIAERLPKEMVQREENASLSRHLIDDVAKQDWFIHFNADNTMKLRDNILAPDLTRKGTLFSLWEAIRLHPNSDNVTIMLKYLTTLTRGKPFEEMFYYQDLLESLGGNSSLMRQYHDLSTELTSENRSVHRTNSSRMRRAASQLVKRLYAR